VQRLQLEGHGLQREGEATQYLPASDVSDAKNQFVEQRRHAPYHSVPQQPAASKAPWHQQLGRQPGVSSQAQQQQPQGASAERLLASAASSAGQQACLDGRAPGTWNPFGQVAKAVKELTPYNPQFRIVARVTKKNSIRIFNYKQKEGQGHLFSIDIADSEGSETRATFFGGAVDRFFEEIKEGHTYSFSGGRIKQADKRWCKCEHEITFDENAVITATDDDGSCPHLILDLKTLQQIGSLAKNSTVDVAAILQEVEAAQDITLKAGGSKTRLHVVLLDDSGAKCRLTVWGEAAQLPWQRGEVALLKGVRSSDYGGVSLNTSFSTSCYFGQDAIRANSRAGALKAWFQTHGSSGVAMARSLTNDTPAAKPPQSLAEMQAEDSSLEVSGNGDQDHPQVLYHTVFPATVTFLPHENKPFYIACPAEVEAGGAGKTRSCNRKVELIGDCWSCSSGHSCRRPKARWIIRFVIADQTASQLVNAFDDKAKDILGCEADEVWHLWEHRESVPEAADRISNIFTAAQFKRFRMRLRSKKERWQDEDRVKVEVMECQPIEHAKEAKTMSRDLLTTTGMRGQPS